MAGIFNTTGGRDPDATSPPPRFRVGYTGRSKLSFTPRLAAVSMQREAGESEARRAAEEKRRIMEMLSPEERADAERFGLDYVAENRQKQEQRAYEQAKQAEALKAQETAARVKAEQARAEEAQKAEAKRGKATGLIGSARTDYLPRAGFRVAAPEPGAAGPAVMMGGGTAAPEPGAAGPVGPYEEQAPAQSVRVLDDSVADMVEKELGLALPPGMMRQTQMDKLKAEALQAERDKRAEQEKLDAPRRKAEAAAAERAKQAETARAWLEKAGVDVTPEDIEEFNVMIQADRATPGAVAAKIRKDKQAKAEKAETKAETLEDTLYKATVEFNKAAAAAAKARSGEKKASPTEQAHLDALAKAAEARVRDIEARIEKRGAAKPAPAATPTAPSEPAATRLQKFGWRTDSNKDAMDKKMQELQAKADANTATPADLEELDALIDWFVEQGDSARAEGVVEPVPDWITKRGGASTIGGGDWLTRQEEMA